MQERRFNTNISGRVSKFTGTDFFVPLHEAISNSIHAIEDRNPTSPAIQVEIIRDSSQLDLDSQDLHAISGFVITDNGIGFDKKNIESFCEADSAHKKARGGKGIGRFSWLKFFDECHVESVFSESGQLYKRVFEFAKTGLKEEDVKETKAVQQTKVSLQKLSDEYASKARKDANHVVINLVEHFIAYLVTETLPALIVVDGAQKISVQEFFARNIKKNAKHSSFTINGNKFSTTSFKFYLGDSKNCAFLCGNKRVAQKVNLASHDHFFKSRFTDEDLKQYAYHIYVESSYLDSIVHDDRDGFRFPELGSLEAGTRTVSRAELINEIARVALDESKEKIDSIKDENLRTVKNFIGSQGAQYRHLLKVHEEELKKIHDNEPQKIDTALRRIQFNEELKTREAVSKLLQAEHVDGDKKNDWREKSKVLFERLNDTGKANLAQYIVQRRYILDLLKKTLEINEDQFAKEEAIHQLIFPMKTTSDEVSFENQNLWIIDERLSYHYYLASDKPLSTVPEEELDSNKEPDIVVFNAPIALNDRQEHEPVESIVIVEFKRPGHSPVKGAKDPVRQVLEYVDIIRSGKAKSRTGRDIKVQNTTYFFGYIICEIDEALRKALLSTPMQQTPDGRGYFGYFNNANTYLEIISYNKMLDDAFKRNRILFDKVQMPTI